MAWRWVTLGLWVFWSLAYWNGGRRIWDDIRKASAASHSRLDVVLLIGLTLASSTMALAGLAVCLGRANVQAWAQGRPITALGALLTGVGMIGTFYCRRYLGRFWTADTALQHDHQVIDTGPYRVVRHPIYSTVLVMHLGMALAFATWWNWLAYILLAIGYALKARDEDRFLATRLVPTYPAYRQRVRHQLVPGVW